MGCLIPIAALIFFAVGSTILKNVIIYGLGSIHPMTFFIELLAAIVVFKYVSAKIEIMKIEAAKAK